MPRVPFPSGSLSRVDLPATPPFVLRGRLLTPLFGGGTRFENDAVVVVDAAGGITYAGSTAERRDLAGDAIDLRPWVLMPGMVDLHAHLPQLPNAGLGAGMDLLAWLERYIFPLERGFDVPTAERVAPAAWRAFAAAGTTTALVYGAVYEASLDATFRAAETHGIRAIVGKVMMDRGTYDSTIDPTTILDRTLAESARLIERWHGADDGRLRYAVTPRFAVSCTAELLRESAALAASTGAYWQTHVSEDQGEIAKVARPEGVQVDRAFDRDLCRVHGQATYPDGGMPAAREVRAEWVATELPRSRATPTKASRTPRHYPTHSFAGGLYPGRKRTASVRLTRD